MALHCTATHQGARQLASTARGAQPPIRIERSAQGLPTTLVEATGARTNFEYGTWGQPDRTTRADGNFEEVVRSGTGKTIRASVNGEPWYEAEYDDQQRLSAIRYADGHFVELKYNDAGQVVEARTPASFVALTYDEEGRLLTEQQDDLVVCYAYDAAGLPVRITAPTGDRVEFDYDDDARLSGVRDWKGAFHEISYDLEGKRVSHRFPNGIVTHRYLLPNTLPREITTLSPDGAARMRLRLSYTPNDQVYGCKDSEIGVRHHRYDDAGRLVRIQSPDAQHDESYGYDGSGNRTIADGVQVTSNAVNQVLKAGDALYEYDARGNLCAESSQGGVTRYSYNGQNLLVEVQTPDGRVITYRYDAFGRRTHKIIASVETRLHLEPRPAPARGSDRQGLGRTARLSVCSGHTPPAFNAR